MTREAAGEPPLEGATYVMQTDEHGHQWRLGGYLLWEDRTTGQWQISDGGGWFEGVYPSAQAAIDGARVQEGLA